MKDSKAVHIVTDSRETISGIPKRLAAMPGVTIESAQLEIGDFLLTSDVVVERKRGHDFAASILDGRLMPQVSS